jgi:hypothetical protein
MNLNWEYLLMMWEWDLNLFVIHLFKFLAEKNFLKGPPYTYLRKNNLTNDWELVDGIEFYYLNILCEIFNLTYSIINENQKYGTKLPNGEWNGVIGRLSKNVRIHFFNNFDSFNDSYSWIKQLFIYYMQNNNNFYRSLIWDWVE